MLARSVSAHIAFGLDYKRASSDRYPLHRYPSRTGSAIRIAPYKAADQAFLLPDRHLQRQFRSQAELIIRHPNHRRCTTVPPV